MSDKKDILLKSYNGNIASLVLNRPKSHNSLSKDLLDELLYEIDFIKNNKKIKVLIIAANGPSFCAGHDLKEIKENNSKSFYEKLFKLCSKLMLSIVELPIPVIAKVHSTATAAGCQLVATCDLAISSKEAKFATPGVNIGLFCSTPMVALSRNISRKHAMEMLLTGEKINADEAVNYGLINKSVPNNLLDKTVNEIANVIASKSPRTIAIGKKAFYKQLEFNLTKAYSYTSEVMTYNIMKNDAREGIDAFLEKRNPDWDKT